MYCNGQCYRSAVLLHHTISADSGRGTRLGECVTKPLLATAAERFASMLRVGALVLAESRYDTPSPSCPSSATTR